MTGLKIRGKDGESYHELLDIANASLPHPLLIWLETAKDFMRLPHIKCHFISNQKAKEVTCLTRVGALGHAYIDKDIFAFVESDDGPEEDCRTIIHELLHFKGYKDGPIPEGEPVQKSDNTDDVKMADAVQRYTMAIRKLYWAYILYGRVNMGQMADVIGYWPKGVTGPQANQTSEVRE